jgi:AcrR family transcriptional regulator
VADPEDLTARARIRDAALAHFGEHGFEKATIRDIAETAGVSSGLVRHHFGSKQALRQACDDYLLRTVRRLNDDVWDAVAAGDVGRATAARMPMGPYQRYIGRTLVDGSGGELFDAIVEMGEAWLTLADERRTEPPHADRRNRAAVVAAMALAVPMLRDHLTRAMGVDLTTQEGDVVLMRTLVDLYSHPLMSQEEAAAARAGLDRIPVKEQRDD